MFKKWRWRRMNLSNCLIDNQLFTIFQGQTSQIRHIFHSAKISSFFHIAGLPLKIVTVDPLLSTHLRQA